jgi:predicted ATP-dependent endonuclease of OLD family
MKYIERMHIEGLKKFERLDITFNPHMNIIVGENEAGKSTILEAIKIVLNQMYKNADKSILKELFNTDMVDKFKKNSDVNTLPYILIEIKLHLEPKDKNAEYFYGENNLAKGEAFGIRFECRFDEELGNGLSAEIRNGKIPYEYYVFRWTAFSGLPYVTVKRPLESIAIDTSESDATSSFNYFNRSLFNSSYTEEEKLIAKNSFRDNLNEAFKALNLSELDAKRTFGINYKKVIFEAILSVYEDDISLENKGSGMESLIKTQIALDKKKSKLDVILIEEPENHLCHINLQKMLYEISIREDESQIIVTTHNNLIASRLNLKNVIWITNTEALSLSNVDKQVADFFVKADGNAFLQMLLSNRIIFVEGATEYILLPYIYLKVTGHTVEEDGVSVISCNGISYKHYLKIAQGTNKKIAVITDNDKKQDRIDKMQSENMNNVEYNIFMDADVDNWTWEVCLYNLNKSILDEIIPVKDDADYLVHGMDCGSKVLGKMLNNKVEIAYLLLKKQIDFEIPQYVKDAIEWLNK